MRTLVASLERRRNIDDQAHPAAAVIDDHDPVVASIGPGKPDHARGGDRERGAARGSRASDRASGRRWR